MKKSKIENVTQEQSLITDGWQSFSKGNPNENETVWLYNRLNKFVALGCRVWVGSDREDAGWFWALSNGTIYEEEGKIVSECETEEEDYAFTHFCRLPVLPPNPLLSVRNGKKND